LKWALDDLNPQVTPLFTLGIGVHAINVGLTARVGNTPEWLGTHPSALLEIALQIFIQELARGLLIRE
jgi:hypothetical protein